MSVHISLKIRFGPLVSFEVTGQNCKEIFEALKGYEELNRQLDSMCTDLAARIYPEGLGAEGAEEEKEEVKE